LKLTFIPILFLALTFGCKTNTTQPTTTDGLTGTLWFQSNGSSAANGIIGLDMAKGTAKQFGLGVDPYQTNGHVIFFGDNLFEVDLGSGVQRTVVTQVTGQTYQNSFNRPQVSPDGRLIAYSDMSSVYLVNYSTGTLVSTIANDGVNGAYDYPTWTQDGRLIIQRGFPNFGLFISDGAIHTFSAYGQNLTQPKNPRVSPDNKQVAFEMSNGIWIMNIDGSGAKQVVANGFSQSGPVWSPDGKWLAYFQNDAPTPVLMNLASGTTQRLRDKYQVVFDKYQNISSGQLDWK
jgi:Tol biopolymer transport system component